MTRSSTKELFTPFKDPIREFRPSSKHFKTISLDKSRSPDFDLLFDQEEYSKEEVAKTMAETIEQYMDKTQADYGSRVARPKIEDNDSFELKANFSRNYVTTPLAQEPDENLYQAWERFKELLMKCPQHYLIEMHEIVLFYNGLDVPTRQILNSRGAIPSKTAADAKVAIQEMAEYSQKWHNGTSKTRSTKISDELAAIQAQLNNLGREIKKVNEKVYDAQVGCEQCKGPHYIKDCPLKEEGKTFKEAYYIQFGASVTVMPLSTYLNLGLGELGHTKLTVELADRTMKYPKGIAENVLVDFTVLKDMEAYRDEGMSDVMANRF
uniref:Eukaryotic translation initiation factor 3 subunit G N-terminal domain-containing protein n=1 Tax=Tanacetum cinerariifolium TaxID=118510 RepID=A0A6L2MC10_TANCI|nr:hypothetical protein [Tanacetum cinerariifolium]